MIYFYTFLFCGIFYFYGDIFYSGWDKIPGSLLDGSFLNYILEHINLYFSGENPLHASLWDLPIFYPSKNALAFSDSLLSVAPFYILLRKFFDYAMSFSIMVIFISILNYVVFYFILRKVKFSKLLSALGAFLFAFSDINKITHMHIQLIMQFFYMGALLLLLNISKYNSKRRNWILFLSSSTLFSLGLYSAYYLGFFYYLVALIAIIISLFIKKYRKILMVFILRYKVQIIVSIIWALIILFPMAKYYLNNGITRSYDIILLSIAPVSMFFKGNTYFIRTFLPFMKEEFNIELCLLFTYFLTAFGIIGLLRFKKYGLLFLFTFIVSFLISVKFISFDNFSLWQYVYKYVPGSIGIREPIRIILILNAFLVLGFIKFLSTSRLNKIVLIFIVMLVLFEQYQDESFNHRSYNNELKTRKELEQILFPSDCKYLDIDFLVDNENDVYLALQEDLARINLMWFASEHGFYFVSGYSGISETFDYKNPKRKKLKDNPGYCVITKHIKN